MALRFSIFLTLLLLCASTSLSPSLTPRFLAWDYVTKSGNLTIQKAYPNFYVTVDFQNHYSDASDSETYDPSAQPMTLALYTSQTVLSQDCSDFFEYDCSDYNCTLYNTTTVSLTLPYMDIEGYYALADVYLDYGNWQLNSDAIVATSCYGNNNDNSDGPSTYGILGLGLDPTTNSSFIGNTTTFSVWLSQNLTSGTLLFSENYDITSSSTFIGSLSTDYEWNISPSTLTVQHESDSVSFSAGVIFDLNADAIGFPSSIYNNVISMLSTTSLSVSCGMELYRPMCSFYGVAADLPTLQLTINDVKIPLPPNVYMSGFYDYDSSDESDSQISFALNFRSLDDTYNNQSYVTEAYENYLILDQNFMSFYYTQFDFGSGDFTISLYQQYTIPTAPIKALVWPYIVGGALLVIVVMSLICCYIKKKRKSQKSRESLANNCDGYHQPVPLITETHIPYHNYNFPPYGYNQGNYGYQTQYPRSYSYGYNHFNSMPQSNFPYVPPQGDNIHGEVL